MRISDLMTRDPVWCTPSCTALQAAVLMRDCHCGTLPVVSSPVSRTVIGIVTDRDQCTKVVGEERSATEALVGACMTPDPVCCSRDEDIHSALCRMGSHRVRRLIVVDHEAHLQGVVSLTDVLEYGAATPAEVAYMLIQIDAPEQHHFASAES